ELAVEDSKRPFRAGPTRRNRVRRGAVGVHPSRVDVGGELDAGARIGGVVDIEFRADGAEVGAEVELAVERGEELRRDVVAADLRRRPAAGVGVELLVAD